MAARLLLASASPRRRELLARAGVVFTSAAAEIDESVGAGECARDYVSRVARAKARALAALHADTWILAADTTVVIDGEVVGKPADALAARHMLARLRGRTHQVLTYVCLRAPDGQEHEVFATTDVTLRAASETELD